jgi:hypothetical protein
VTILNPNDKDSAIVSAAKFNLRALTCRPRTLLRTLLLVVPDEKSDAQSHELQVNANTKTLRTVSDVCSDGDWAALDVFVHAPSHGFHEKLQAVLRRHFWDRNHVKRCPVRVHVYFGRDNLKYMTEQEALEWARLGQQDSFQDENRFTFFGPGQPALGNLASLCARLISRVSPRLVEAWQLYTSLFSLSFLLDPRRENMLDKTKFADQARLAQRREQFVLEFSQLHAEAQRDADSTKYCTALLNSPWASCLPPYKLEIVKALAANQGQSARLEGPVCDLLLDLAPVLEREQLAFRQIGDWSLNKQQGFTNVGDEVRGQHFVAERHFMLNSSVDRIGQFVEDLLVAALNRT